MSQSLAESFVKPLRGIVACCFCFQGAPRCAATGRRNGTPSRYRCMVLFTFEKHEAVVARRAILTGPSPRITVEAKW